MYQIAIIDHGIPEPQKLMDSSEIVALEEAMSIEVDVYRKLGLVIETYVSEVK